MKVQGQLERAQLENLTSLPTVGTTGRILQNTTDGKSYLDDGLTWRALLRNDQKIIIGNDATAANNIRFHRGGAGFLQVLPGSDTTAEGTLSTTLAQVSMRHGNFTTGTLPANGNAGRIVYLTDTGFLSSDTGSAWKVLVDDSTAQTISGKTLTDPTLSSSAVFSQITTPALPAAGTRKMYAKADGFYQIDSTGIETKVGSGSGTGATPLNALFTNPDAETNAPGFVPYADVVSAVPTTGIGGTPTLTFVRSTVTPIDGLNSWLLTKPASNIQGQGVYTTVTVPTAFQGRVLQGSFSCKVLTGTYTDGDAQLFFYDITNSVLVPMVEGQSILNAIGSQDQLFRFQMPYNCSSGRFLIHWAGTSTTALTMQFDDFSLGKQLTARGAAVTDWQNYTLTPTSSGGANPTKATVNYSYSKWRRVGDSMEIQYNFYGTGAGNGGTGVYLFNLPTGYSIDPSFTNGSTNGDLGQNVGSASAYSVPSNRLSGFVYAADANHLAISACNDLQASLPISSTFATWANSGDAVVQFSALVKILGWSSSTAMSADVSSGLAISQAQISTSTTVSANVPINFDSVLFDTNGAITTGVGTWKYTSKSSGYYRFTMISDCTVSNGSNYILKNGATNVGYISTNPAGNVGSGSAIAYLAAGDYAQILCNGTETFAGPGLLNVITIERINSGSQQIAATERICATYGLTTNQSVSANAVIKYDTKVEDTHGRFDASTGLLTTNFSGKLIISVVGGSVNAMSLYVKKNGVGVSYLTTVQANVIAGSTIEIVVAAGDTVGIYTDTASTTFFGASAQGFNNQVTFKRAT